MTRQPSTVVFPAGTLTRHPRPCVAIDAELALRPWAHGDAPAVLTAFSDPAIQQWHARTCDTLDEAQRWIDEADEAWQTERCTAWAIASHIDQVLGRVAIHTDMPAGTGEISYWVLPTARRQGVAVRAARAATTWAHRAGFRRVELQHSVHNQPSRRVALAAGFTEEGIRRQAARHADGWHDMRLYAHLDTD